MSIWEATWERPVSDGSFKVFGSLNNDPWSGVRAARESMEGGVNRLLSLRRLQARAIEIIPARVEVAAALSHQNLVRVHGLKRLDNALVLAHEFVPGLDVDHLLGSMRCWFDVSTSSTIAAQAAEALGYLHAQKDMLGRPQPLCHGGVGPDKLLVSFSGAVKLVDFGVVPVSERAGTPVESWPLQALCRLAPERFAGDDPTIAADIYALGVCLYEMLTGLCPFRRGSFKDTLSAVGAAQILPPSHYQPTTPAKLDELVMAMLSANAEDRPASAKEVAQSLKAMQSSEELGGWLRRNFEVPCRVRELQLKRMLALEEHQEPVEVRPAAAPPTAAPPAEARPAEAPQPVAPPAQAPTDDLDTVDPEEDTDSHQLVLTADTGEFQPTDLETDVQLFSYAVETSDAAPIVEPSPIESGSVVEPRSIAEPRVDDAAITNITFEDAPPPGFSEQVKIQPVLPAQEVPPILVAPTSEEDDALQTLPVRKPDERATSTQDDVSTVHDESGEHSAISMVREMIAHSLSTTGVPTPHSPQAQVIEVEPGAQMVSPVQSNPDMNPSVMAAVTEAEPDDGQETVDDVPSVAEAVPSQPQFQPLPSQAPPAQNENLQEILELPSAPGQGPMKGGPGVGTKLFLLGLALVGLLGAAQVWQKRNTPVLKVVAKPSEGVAVWIDGTLHDPQQIRLDPGVHTLELKRDGVLKHKRSFDLKSGSTHQLVVYLDAP